MLSTKREGESYTKVTRFYFCACSPLPIRDCKPATIEWVWSVIFPWAEPRP